MILHIKFTSIFLTILIGNLVSQSLPIKEQYDALEDKSPNNMGLYKFISNISNNNNFPQHNNDDVLDYDNLLANRFADVFASFLTMYKTTRDKAYLHKFISQTYFVQQFRNDKQTPATNPNKGWWQLTHKIFKNENA